MTDHDCKTLLDLAAKATPDMVPDVQHMDGWYIACGPHHPDEAAAHDDAAYLAAAANAVPWLIEDRRRLMSGILGSLQTCEVCRCRYDRANGAMCKCERRRPYRIKLEESQAEVERLRAENEQHRAWFGCPSCGENHPDGTMCPPHEMRTTGREWFHAAIRAAKADNNRLRAENERMLSNSATCLAGLGKTEESVDPVFTLGILATGFKADNERLRAALEAANAGAAAMREALDRTHFHEGDNFKSVPCVGIGCCIIADAMSSDAGLRELRRRETAEACAEVASAYRCLSRSEGPGDLTFQSGAELDAALIAWRQAVKEATT